ncbi:uncharacterized protein LOC111885201 [Lactuca sativa]|uniref:uncharacterized protein LOC111885201 n=1 Tax=Lactuca sativa TaxID=4236 RepID=UPI0022AEB6E3|nr:uncharacterized protein LOC111885201 [Lactuca sativa]
MAGNSLKEMNTTCGKFEKFQGQDFRCWQKKMHFSLTTLKVVYVLSTPKPEGVEDAILEHIRSRSKWENDNYICLGHILNGMCDSLFNTHQNIENASELWNTLEAKYIAEDASSKKFIVSDFNNYKMVDSQSVMEQYNEILRIYGQFKQLNMYMDESFAVSSVIDKLPPSWKDFKHHLKHRKEEISLIQLGSHLKIEEGLRDQDNDKGTGKGESEFGQPQVHMVDCDKEDNSNNKGKGKKRKYEGNKKKSKKKHKDSKELVCWRCHLKGHMKRDCRVKLGNKGASGSGKDAGGGSGSHDQSATKGG